jgi:hypothetical protein
MKMGGMKLGELNQQVDQINKTLEGLLIEMDNLDNTTTIISRPDLHKCAPIRVEPPTMIQNCMTKIGTVDAEVKLEDLSNTLRIIKDWLNNINRVIAEVDPDQPLPPKLPNI